MSKKQSVRVTNSFSPDEVEVLAHLFEKAPMLSAYGVIVKKPAFAQLYAKVNRMRALAREKKTSGEEVAIPS